MDARPVAQVAFGSVGRCVMTCKPIDPALFEDRPVGECGPVRPHFDHSLIPYEEWRGLRSGYVGASEVSTILGRNRWSGPFDLACVKLGRVDPLSPGLPMRMGTFFEPAIRDFFADELANARVEVPGGIDFGSKVSAYNYTIKHDRIPFFCCNLDGLIEPTDGGSVWALEIKDAGTYAATDLRHWLEGDKPEGVALMYWIQIQAQLAATGLDRAMFVARCDKALLCGPVYRSQKAIDAIEAQVVAFWERYLAADELPPVDRHSSGVLDRLHAPQNAQGTDERPELADTVSKLRSELATIKAEIKERTAKESQIKNQFKQMIGDLEIITLGDGMKPIKWKQYTKRDGTKYRRLII